MVRGCGGYHGKIYWIPFVNTKCFMILEVKEAHWCLHVSHQIDVCFPSSLCFLQLKLIPVSCFVGPGSTNIPKVSAKLSKKHVQVISIWSRAIAPNLESLRSTHSRVWVSRITLMLSRDLPSAVQWHQPGLIAADEAQKGNRYVHPNRVSAQRQAFRSW